MSKYIVKMISAYTGETIEVFDDEVFDNEYDAEAYACECGGAYSQGAECLSLMGRDYDDRKNVEFVVEEIDED